MGPGVSSVIRTLLVLACSRRTGLAAGPRVYSANRVRRWLACTAGCPAVDGVQSRPRQGPRRSADITTQAGQDHQPTLLSPVELLSPGRNATMACDQSLAGSAAATRTVRLRSGHRIMEPRRSDAPGSNCWQSGCRSSRVMEKPGRPACSLTRGRPRRPATRSSSASVSSRVSRASSIYASCRASCRCWLEHPPHLRPL